MSVDPYSIEVPQEVGRKAHRIGVGALLLLIVVQLDWYLRAAPPQTIPVTWVLAFMLTPLLVPAIGVVLKRPKALFWAGFMSMLHFMHGVSEAWTVPEVRELALLEVLFSSVLACAAGWHGMARRKAWRRLFSQALDRQSMGRD
ncbi:MAG: DUF2069 domain-containing protein [Xanthomonadales bacterium]|jgi:uncharacterized membrane protein|nr:DUF2069 domain-containing protein [Xanthomonadales bacterium]